MKWLSIRQALVNLQAPQPTENEKLWCDHPSPQTPQSNVWEGLMMHNPVSRSQWQITQLLGMITSVSSDPLSDLRSSHSFWSLPSSPLNNVLSLCLALINLFCLRLFCVNPWTLFLQDQDLLAPEPITRSGNISTKSSNLDFLPWSFSGLKLYLTPTQTSISLQGTEKTSLSYFV
jgi:hypothetical protein